MLDKLSVALELAFNQFRKEFGEDAKLDEGEEIYAVFNDGLLIVGIEDN